MEISEDTILAFQQATRRQDRSGCPPAADLAGLSRGELSPARRDCLVDHLVECADCALEVRVATGVDELAAAGGEVVPESRHRRRSASVAWLGAAVAAALVVVAGIVWQSGPGRAPASLERAAPLVVEPLPGSTLEARPAVLSWPAQAGAEGYRVEILDAGARPLWRSPWLDEPRAELPGRLDMPRGNYLWIVEVRGFVADRELGPFDFAVD